MGYFKLNSDGTFQSSTAQLDGFTSMEGLQKDANGGYYNYYLLAPNADGIYQPDMDKVSADALEMLEASITAKATEIIETAYSPLKQRKMMSIAIALQDKVLQGGTLTVSEEALLQANRDANTWIGGIRTIENTSIANSTALADINWGE